MSSRLAVLVTRPAGQAKPLCEALVNTGYCAFEQPLLELQQRSGITPEFHRHIENLDNYQHIIFISGNAVRYGMEKMQQNWPQFPRGNTVYAIGETTAMMLRQYGLEVSCADAGQMTTESLLELDQLQRMHGQKVLIVKGVGGRNTLREALSARGAGVDELACYERKCPELAPGELAGKLSTWNINIVLLSSGEGFCNMLTLLRPAETIKLYTMPLIVPSARVAGMAREAGFSAVFEAKNATNHAMLEAVQRCSATLENNK